MEPMDIALLQNYFLSDMIKQDVAEQQLNMIKKNKVQDIHTFAITPPTEGVQGSRWQTYVMKGEKRSKVSAVDEDGLYAKLYEHYFKQNLSLEMLYPEWVEKRKTSNVNPRTVRRNQNHWDKYYKDDKIVKIPIPSITAEHLETFFHSCIKKHDLTLKELNNMKFIMKDMLKLAKRKKCIISNPYDDMELNTNACRPGTKLNDVSRVFLPEEQDDFFAALHEERLRNPDNTDCYAVSLLFKLGLRIGELCALKWEDIDLATAEIHIHRMETQDEDKNGRLVPVVVAYTKKRSPFGDRFLPLDEYEIELFRTVSRINEENGYRDGDYIFCDENGRTKIREIDNRIRKICNHAGIIPAKSAHDIRRTVATQMHMNGVPIQIIKEYLGHSDTQTTWGYIVNNKKKQEVHEMIRNSLKNLNGLKRTQTKEKAKTRKTA